jgi:signal transduction histidine kinase/CheY-like chemotaxis protein
MSPSAPAAPAHTDAAAPQAVQTLPLEQRILQEQVDALLGTGLQATISTIIVTAGFAAVFYYQTRLVGVLVWAACLHASQAVRLVGNLRYLKTPAAQRAHLRAAHWYCHALSVNGVAWGVMPWLFFPKGNFALSSLVMLVMWGMSSAGIASQAPYRRAIFSFNVPMMVGLATALFWQADAMHAFLAVCTLIYLYVNIKFGLQQNRLLTEALRARYEKEELAQQLAEQVHIAQRASREKTLFFASASHDLRQPLHSLGLFGSALLARLKSTPDEPIARNLMHCVDALETSFSAMLDVSKLDAGVIQPKIVPTPVADVFRKLASTYAAHADAQGLALRFKPGNKWVHTDAQLLERLLGNLIHNALKFTEHGGVTLLARTLHSASGPQVRVEVWDTGPGIPASELPRIFDEFYQVGNQARDRAKGMGMGLAIVQRLVDLMGLKLSVQSKRERGTVFKLVLPSAPAQAKPSLASPMESASGTFRALSSLTVLVIDDEENVRISTAAALRQYGLQVKMADGLAQARAQAAQLGTGLNAIISDFRLRNNEDGIQVITTLRQQLQRSVPALLVTGDTAPERVRQAQQSGLQVLYKPVKIHVLVEALRQLTDVQPARPASTPHSARAAAPSNCLESGEFQAF